MLEIYLVIEYQEVFLVMILGLVLLHCKLIIVIVIWYQLIFFCWSYVSDNQLTEGIPLFLGNTAAECD